MSTPTSASGSTFTLGQDFTDAALLASYAHGRLLSATDLSTDQQTLATRDRWIGRAAGAGVVDGLTVTASATTLTVAPGLGLTGTGEPVVLNQTTSLPLAVPLAEAGSNADPARFSCCGTPAAGSTALVGAGSYVLTARSASQRQGNAATASPPGVVGGGGCAAAWTAAGIEFRVTALPVGGEVAGVTMTADNRRNLVATWCFGAEQRGALAAAPFGDPDPYGLELAGIGADDLPLAVLAWDGQIIADTDLWSVRRHIARGPLGGDTWGLLTSQERISEGQARFRQFQDQVAELVRKQVAEKVSAAATFPVLPPVGFLPVAAPDQKGLAQAAADRLERLDRLEGAEKTDDTAPEATPAAADGAGGSVRGIDESESPKPDRLAQERLELLLIARALAAASGSGFTREAFFGTSARFGGIIDFELAELLLRESWYRPPLVLTQAASEDDKNEAGGSDDSGRDGPNRVRADLPGGPRDTYEPDLPDGRTPPVTFYLIRENLVALAGKTAGKRQRLLDQLLGVSSAAGAYVVFVSNYRWYGASRPPATVIEALAQLRR